MFGSGDGDFLPCVAPNCHTAQTSPEPARWGKGRRGEARETGLSRGLGYSGSYRYLYSNKGGGT